MRHWWMATVAAMGAALVLSLGLTSWQIEPGRVRGDLAEALGSAEASAASLRLLPRPTVTLENLRFRAAGGALTASAAEAQVTLRFDRLLFGAFAPLGVTLRDADFHIDLDAIEPAIAGLSGPPVSRLRVERGGVEIVSTRRGWRSRVDLTDGRADWTSPDGALRASAAGRWRGQPAAASIDLGAPLAAARGGATPVRLALSSTALAEFDFAGDWTPRGRSEGFYRGQATALVPSLERLARWMGWTPASARRRRVSSFRRGSAPIPC